MSVKLLTEYHLEFLSLKGGCTGLSESTLVKTPHCCKSHDAAHLLSDFIWDSGKLPFPSYLRKYFIKIGKISAKIHEIGKIKAIFGLGMTPI